MVECLITWCISAYGLVRNLGHGYSLHKTVGEKYLDCVLFPVRFSSEHLTLYYSMRLQKKICEWQWSDGADSATCSSRLTLLRMYIWITFLLHTVILYRTYIVIVTHQLQTQRKYLVPTWILCDFYATMVSHLVYADYFYFRVYFRLRNRILPCCVLMKYAYCAQYAHFLYA